MKFRYFPTFGDLPNTWSSLGLIVVVGFVEGFGLSLFIPLLEIMQTGRFETDNAIFRYIKLVYSYLHLEVTLNTLLIGIVFVVSASLFLTFIQHVIISKSMNLYTRQLRDRFTHSFINSDMEHLSGLNHGSIINFLVQESYRGSFALLAEIMCAAAIIQIIILLGFATVISWQLVLLSLLFVTLALLVIYRFLFMAKKLGEERTKINGYMSFVSLEVLRSSKFIRLTASEDSVLQRLHAIFKDSCRIYYLADVNKSAVSLISQLFPLFLLATSISFSFHLMTISSSMIIVFLLILVRIMPKVIQLQQQYQTYMTASPSLNIVIEETIKNEQNRENRIANGKMFSGLQHEIQLKNIKYTYRNSDVPAIHDVSFSLERNSYTAFVGVSGSGKSTLLDIITGIRRPDAGTVLVDGTDINQLDTISWRTRIGYVGQETTIFNDTIRNNLRFAHPEASDEQIMRCLRLAHFTEVLNALPNGLDTVLGDNGTRLSGGERQRLAIARALIGSPDLLIFDEATSALDNESEHHVQSAIESIAGEITIIVIAHRLSTIKMADTIHVLENGRIIESGTFKQLLSSNQRFSELYKHSYV